MRFKRQLKAAGATLLDFDNGTHELLTRYGGTLPVQMLDVVSKLGDQPALRTISAALVVAGTLSGKDRLVRAGARMMIAHEAATFAKDAVKTQLDRTRPRSANGRGEKKLKKGKHTAKEQTSFPSGHSAGAIATARAFSREFPEYGAAAMGAAVFVALGQIPRCAHYPTDVAAGLAVGLASEKLTDVLWDAGSMDERSA